MSRINISKIVYDASTYPRGKWNTSTVNEYADCLRAGDKFPPVVLEKGTNRLLDGVHRWKAHYKYIEEYRINQEKKEPEDGFAPIDETIEIVYHEIPEGIPAKLYAASLSANHGLRISPSDRKAIAREIYEDNPDFTLKYLNEYLGVSMGTAHNYVADILARRKEERLMVAYRLHRLGWTQEEIGEAVGLAQKNIHEKLYEFSELKKRIKNLANGGLPYLDIAERHKMPLILVWASILDGIGDQERMDKLGISIQPYDVWNFGKCNDLFGRDHPGRIPGQLIAHVLYFYTKQGDTIIDPMCGGGTTQDVCLAMGRECYAFDIDTRHERSDVIVHNIVKDGWHNRIKNANLIFFDPPYFNKMDDGYIDESISALGRDDYLQFFKDRLSEAYKDVKPGTKIAFLMSDWDDQKGNEEGIFVWDYADILRESGWKLIRQIQVPLSTQQVHPDIVVKFRKSKRLARLERYLIIGEK